MIEINTKKEHFIPRCYLKNFSSSGYMNKCVKKSENQVLVYNKLKKNKYVSRIYDIACENYFYDLDNVDNIEEKLIIEKALGEIESGFSNLLDKFIRICDNKENINSALITKRSEREKFAYYIVIQLLRTKKFREIQKNFYQKMLDQRLTFYKLFRKNYFGEDINLSAGDILINGKTIHLERLFDDELIDEMSLFILDSYWTFIYNDTLVPFIISDNPVCRIPILDNYGINNEMELSSFMSNSLEINFPLNNKISLHIYRNKSIFYKQFGKALNNRLILVGKEDLIHDMNKYQCIMADERVFFRCKDDSLIDLYFNESVTNKKYSIF